jgi:hypothetical protein
MTSKQTSKESLKSIAKTMPIKRRKITLAILIIAVSLSVGIEFGVATSLTQGYSTPADSNKNTLCIGKVQDLSQKGVIRDVGGFNGAIYECMHMKSANSIYGDVFSTLKI